VSARKKIYLTVTALFLSLVLVTATQSCFRAGREKARIRSGMSVAEVFTLTENWDLGSIYRSADEAPWRHFSVSHGSDIYRLVSSDQQRTLSRDELIDELQKDMEHGNWHAEFTYMGNPRFTFRVDFQEGKVIYASDGAGGP